MKINYLIGAVVVVALGVFAVALLGQSAAPAGPTLVDSQTQTQVQVETVAQTPAPQTQPTEPAKSGYTMAQVAQHASASSCWAAINGKVYNLTDWIGQHPGGAQRIINLCGTDGSAAFNGQHDGQARPASELTNFYLGALVQ